MGNRLSLPVNYVSYDENHKRHIKWNSYRLQTRASCIMLAVLKKKKKTQQCNNLNVRANVWSHWRNFTGTKVLFSNQFENEQNLHRELFCYGNSQSRRFILKVLSKFCRQKGLLSILSVVQWYIKHSSHRQY